jgi:EAL domain-containing protein (putative c-di-GMP-specific phosphodiesterase class I)
MSLRREDLSDDLRQAVAAGELRVEYQPILSAVRGVVGAEALLRWSHSALGDRSPATSLSLTEETRVIDEIGRFLLSQACLDRGSWPSRDGRSLGVAVNVSPSQLLFGGFAESVVAVLVETDTPPELLTLEITESALIDDHPRAVVVLQELEGLGVRLALDDFGTDASSVSHLEDFAVGIVKLDRAFVGELSVGSASRQIVVAMVTLAHRLGISVAAQGVETGEQYKYVLELGCDYYQGRHFSPPVSAETFTRQVAADRR